MKAINIAKYGRFPQLIDLPIPQLEKDHFLIKMKYAPINPSDINFFQGFYGIRKSGTPIVGFQGSGIILDSQNEQYKNLVGKWVSVLANKSNGTFATHIVSHPDELIVWPDQEKQDDQGLKQLSMSWINPVSCIGLTQSIDQHNFETVILSACTSQLGRMLVRYIKKKHPKIRVIGFSRSDSKDSELINLGIDDVGRLEDTEKIFKIKQTEKRVLFLDCIGGEFASKMFNALPQDSVMVSYGRLSRQPLNNIDLGELYFGNKRIEGFWMNTFLKQITHNQLVEVKKQVIANHKHIFCQKIRKEHSIDDFMDAIRESIKDPASGKVILAL